MTHAKRTPTKAELIASLDASGRRLEPTPVQIYPIVIDLIGCQIKVDDAEVNGRPGKVITFIHMTGALAAKASLPMAAAHDVATRLTAPAGITIPTNGETPA